MKFGVFTSAQANSGDLGPETGQGFREWLDFNVEAEALGFHVELSGRASFHRLEPSFLDLDAAHGARHAYQDAAARLGRHGAAVAQSGAARRTGGDARSDFRRSFRFRHRQGLPAQRVPRLSDRARGSRGALRRGRGGDEARLHHGRSFLPLRPLLALRGYRRGAAAGAAAASAVLGGRREREIDPPRRGARFQPDPRSIRQPGTDCRAHRHLQSRAQAARPGFRSHAGRSGAPALCRER